MFDAKEENTVQRFCQIAIDGPSAAGKSTAARLIAKNLGFMYVDTGAMYRAFALKLKLMGLAPDVDKEFDLAALLNVAKKTTIKLEYADDKTKVILDGNDVTSEIRHREISELTSRVSAIPEIRMWLVEQQRQIARDNNVVMDGRDIGTYCLPNATVKFFLIASLADRAKRRFDELTKNGVSVTLDEVADDIAKRDKRDESRAFAPCVAALDAIEIDNSKYSVDETSDIMTKIAKERISCSSQCCTKS